MTSTTSCRLRRFSRTKAGHHRWRVYDSSPHANRELARGHEDNGPSRRKDCDALSASRIGSRSPPHWITVCRTMLLKHGRSEKGVTTPFESHPKNFNEGRSLTTEANVD